MDVLTQLPAQPMLAFGLALIAASLIGALVLVVRRRRVVAVGAVPSDVQPEVEVEVEVDVEADVEAEDEAEPTSVVVRALRAQVRVLEEALASAAEQHQEESTDLAAYRRQVRCAVEAVAQSNDPQDADGRTRHAVARVAAAIERLDAPEGLVRPALPAVALERTETVERRAGLVAVAPLVETVPARVSEPVAAIEPPVQQLPEPVSVVEPEVVLPVPPPAPASTRRSRRRLRHPAA